MKLVVTPKELKQTAKQNATNIKENKRDLFQKNCALTLQEQIEIWLK